MADDSATILSLLPAGGPAAVLRGVRPIVVNALQGSSSRAHTHVLQEEPEIAPPIADNDAPAAVSVVMGSVGVIAPISHRKPTSISGRTPSSVLGVSVPPVAEVPTIGGFPRGKVTSLDEADFPAGALANPSSLFALRGSEPKDRILAEGAVNQLELTHMTSSAITVSQHGGWRRGR